MKNYMDFIVTKEYGLIVEEKDVTKTLTVINSKQDLPYFLDSEGQYWRCVNYVEDSVTYDEVNREIIIKKTEKEIKLTIGSSQMMVDGNIIEMDTTAIIYNDSTYIPVRFVAEALGCEVSYDRAVTGYMMNEYGVLVPTYD